MGRLAILVILCTASVSSCLTSKIINDEEKNYSEVLQFEDSDKDDIYSLTNRWLVTNFVSAESMIEYQDKEEGLIVGKYVDEFSHSGYQEYLMQTITLEVKDNKLRISFENPLYKRFYNGKPTSMRGDYRPIDSDFYVNRLESERSKMIQSLKKYIMSRNETDW